MGEEPDTDFERAQLKSTQSKTYVEDVLPTYSPSQVGSSVFSGRVGTVSGTTEVVNTGSIPSRAVLTRLEVAGRGGTATVVSDIRGAGTSGTATAFIDPVAHFGSITAHPDRVEHRQPFRDGGLGVVESGGSVVTNLQGTMEQVTVSGRLVHVENV